MRYLPAPPATGGHAGAGLTGLRWAHERLRRRVGAAADRAGRSLQRSPTIRTWALAGYRLDDGEVELLRSQVVGDTAADVAKVETRTNKSSTFGLLAPFAALGGLADQFGRHPAEPGGGSGGAGAREAFGDVPGARQELGRRAGAAGAG